MTLPYCPASTLITCHSNADWDALSSMLGLSLLYPDACLIFPGSMEKTLLRFFTEAVEPLFRFKSSREIDPQDVRLLVIADTRQRSRLKHIEDVLRMPDVEIHVWDHHPEPETRDAVPASFLRIEPVGSTCTLVCRALAAQNISVKCEMATLLGLGLYADTGAFTYTSTTSEDFRAAAWLRERGMELPVIADLIRHDMTSAHVKILNSLIDSATVHEVGAYHIVITEAASEAFIGDFAYLAQKFMEMEPCHVLFALANMDDKVQLVARSRVDAVDVSEICKSLGGGGHRFAASASIKGMTIPEVRDAIFRWIYAQTHPDKRAGDLMSSPARGVEEQRTIKEAETVMNRYGLKAVPIFRTGTRQCVGYMEGQVASKAVTHGLGDMPVSIYMRRDMLTAYPDTSLQRLVEIIIGARQRLIPIVEKNDVIGVVTRTDLINLFVEEPGGIPLPRETDKQERDLSRVMRSRLSRPLLDLLGRAGALGDRLGVNVYAVGGFVRDLVLSRPSADFDDVDLVVEGDGIAFARELAQELGGRVREHKTFMTALVIYHDEDGREQRLDVATARLEYYEYPAALPTVELSSIKMDLFRRDFTINAMALRLNAAAFGHLVDFFGGRNDIQKKIIRVIHALSFIEDPTRILRAVRFEQRYGFRISIQGEKLIKNALSLKLVERLSGSRIVHELNLLFHESAPFTCLSRLERLGVLEAIHPTLSLNREKSDLLVSLREVLDWYHLLYADELPSVSAVYLLALCSGASPEEAAEVFERLGLAKTARKDLLALRQEIRTACSRLSSWGKTRKTGDTPISQLCALLAPLSLEGALYVMARTPDEELRGFVSQYIYKWRHVRADITGEDLKALGLPEGPRYSEIMRTILAAKLDNQAPTREAQLALAKQLVAGEQALSTPSGSRADCPARMASQ